MACSAICKFRNKVKALLISIVGGECSYAEYPKLTSPSQLRNCVLAGNQGMTGSLFVDGTQFKNLQNYRATSGLFNMTLPANNAPGVVAGTTQAVADGLWVMLEPLSKGNHVLHFTGAIIDPTTGTQNYSTDVTYNLTVE